MPYSCTDREHLAAFLVIVLSSGERSKADNPYRYLANVVYIIFCQEKKVRAGLQSAKLRIKEKYIAS